MTEPAFYARYSGATQRARLLDAVTRIVAERGFAAATVSEICKAAGVSRTTFYEQFEGKFDCLAHAYETATTITVDAVAAAAIRPDADWSDAMAAGVTAYFDMVRAEPAIARMTLVEFRGAGPESLAPARRSHDRWAEQILALQSAVGGRGSGAPPLSESAVAVVLAGISERVAQALDAGDLAALDEIRDGAIELFGAAPAAAKASRRRR